jgi:hypothetical protein
VITTLLYKWIFTLIIAFLFTSGAFGVTEAECKKRIITSMENSSALGGNKADEYKWGQYAAQECIKELNSTSSNSENESKGKALFGIMALAGILLVVFFLGHTVLFGAIVPAQENNKRKIAEEEEKKRVSLLTPEELQEEIEAERKRKIWKAIQNDLPQMTLEQISNRIESPRMAVLNRLCRLNLECKDFKPDDLSNLTLKQICKLVNGSEFFVKGMMGTFQLSCKDYSPGKRSDV